MFGHKLNIGTPYRGKCFWTNRIPTSCLPTLLIFIHIEHICSFFVTFFSATIDGRNLIFGHKLHIGTPYRGKRFWTHRIPTSCLPTLLIFYTHWTYMLIFRRIFLSNYWWQKSDIWSQASYRYPIPWEAFLNPSDSYFLFADFVDFLYTLNIYAHFSSHFSQQLLMAEIWCLATSLILVPHIVGSVFEPIGFLLPVCRLCWFLYTLKIYAHFSSHFSQQLLMAEIWYLVTSFI